MAEKIVAMPDLELEAQLRKYTASKKARSTAEAGMLDEFSESDDDMVTIGQTYDSDCLEIEEDDDE